MPFRDISSKPISTSQNPSPTQEKKGTLRLPFGRFWRSLGPGIVTGASGDDPSGIGTYSIAGAQYGYQLLWLSWLLYPLAAAVQEACARIALVTGHGLAAVTKKHYGKPLLFGVAFLLVSANTVNIGADLQAMTATVLLVAPGLNFAAVALFITLLTLGLLILLPYTHYVRYLKVASLVLLSYVLVAFLSTIDWQAVLAGFLLPTLNLQPAYLLAVFGTIGTSISPYMFFWQASEEVEEEVAMGLIRDNDPKTSHPGLRKLDPRIIKDMRIDVNAGMFYSQLIMFFIIVSTAGNLYTGGMVKDVSQLTLEQLANVLRPLVGDTAFLLFALGIVGVGLLAIPVLAGSASYAISELFGWQEGLNKKFHEAKGFYLVIVLATLTGLILNFVGIQPVAALYYTAILNGLVAVPLLFIIWRMSNSQKILGEHTSGWLSNTLIVITLLIMTAGAISLFLLKN